MLLPRICPLCDRPGDAPCATCRGELVRAPELPLPPGVDSCTALLLYDGAGRELVARMKYRNARSTMRWMTRSMAALVASRRDTLDAVSWIPTSAPRRRTRGFDQAQLLARGVARELRLPSHAVLVRGPGAPQTGRTLADRRAGPVLLAHQRARRVARVLLVDDVITTGSTIAAAARVLRGAGVARIDVLAAARTPLKRVRETPENLRE